MTIEAYPLAWPAGWNRTPTFRRQPGAFKVTLATARDGLLQEIRQLGGRHPVLSSNMMLRQDGLPYASQRKPEDPGIAVYFDYKGRQMCFACDKYSGVESNARAIQLSIAAIRGLGRWGASDMLDRAFTGFVALPSNSSHWSDVLGVPRTAGKDEIEAAYRRLRSQHHPDKGGDGDQFQRIQQAYAEATAA